MLRYSWTTSDVSPISRREKIIDEINETNYIDFDLFTENIVDDENEKKEEFNEKSNLVDTKIVPDPWSEIVSYMKRFHFIAISLAAFLSFELFFVK